MKTDLESPFKISCFRSAISGFAPGSKPTMKVIVTRTGYLSSARVDRTDRDVSGSRWQ